MNCRQTQFLLPDYIDDAARAAQIEAHLRACDGCRAQLHELRSTQKSVRKALDSYPRSRIENAAAFDARVLNVVMSRRNGQSKLDVFLDRCDTIFARPLWKLLASSVSGTLFGLLLIAPMMPRGAAVEVTSQSAPLSATATLSEANRFYAWNGWRRDVSRSQLLREVEREAEGEALQLAAPRPSLQPPPAPKPRRSHPSRASQRWHEMQVA